jgi:hypothetical protein
MKFSQTRVRLVQAGASFAAVLLVAGCGNNYRPVVTPTNPTGPASQVSSYAVVVSAPSPSTPGIATIFDYSGDTEMATAPIGPGPSAFSVDLNGANGYTINSDGTLTNFPLSVTGNGSLRPQNVGTSTLLRGSNPLNLLSPASGLWVADTAVNAADVLVGIPAAYLLSVPLADAPVMTVGSGSSGQRLFGISQNISDLTAGTDCNLSPKTQPYGEVTGIEPSSYGTEPPIQVGRCPVFALESADFKRLFVLNRGDDTITVINAPNSTLDSCVCPATGCVNQSGQKYFCHPTLPLSTTALTAPGVVTPPNCNLTADPTCGGMTATAGPVYAEYNAPTNQLVVADYDGNTISVIDVSLDEYGNDSSTFGTTFTIPVGNNPASVTAINDIDNGMRAYTANQTDETVTIVNLVSHTVEKTLAVTGHPRTVVSTLNSTQGKVYVASPDSNVLTIIRTDLDILDATPSVQGHIVDVRVTTQTGSGTNSNNVSRRPGYGQPCNLPLTGTYTLTACQTQP